MRLPVVSTGLWNVSVTDAMPEGLREDEPLKMTSIIASPRRLLADCSPRTHLMASTTLDLPQPLGPTMPVIGASKAISVRSANDLKPQSVSLARRMQFDLHVDFRPDCSVLNNIQPPPAQNG